MARGFRFGGAGGGTSSSVLYDSGRWNVEYDNPGDYTYSGYTVQPATLNANSFQINGSGTTVLAIGVRNAVDLTKYSTIRVRCYATGSGSFCKLGVWASKVLSNTVEAYVFAPLGTGYTEVVVDVSGLTGYHYIACQSAKAANCVAYFEKIWLE